MTRIYLLNYKHKKNIDMNKKIIGTVVIATALFAGYNMYESSAEMKLSDLALANIEALADTENNVNSGKICYKETVIVEDETGIGVNVFDCDDCSKQVRILHAEQASKCK